ncbi:hypothetical protein BDZ90DRAFT_275308, partial [Jaminaea rosea]
MQTPMSIASTLANPWSNILKCACPPAASLLPRSTTSAHPPSSLSKIPSAPSRSGVQRVAAKTFSTFSFRTNFHRSTTVRSLLVGLRSLSMTTEGFILNPVRAHSVTWQVSMRRSLARSQKGLSTKASLMQSSARLAYAQAPSLLYSHFIRHVRLCLSHSTLPNLPSLSGQLK